MRLKSNMFFEWLVIPWQMLVPNIIIDTCIYIVVLKEGEYIYNIYNSIERRGFDAKHGQLRTNWEKNLNSILGCCLATTYVVFSLCL